jgi:hypothetical protein
MLPAPQPRRDFGRIIIIPPAGAILDVRSLRRATQAAMRPAIARLLAILSIGCQASDSTKQMPACIKRFQ